MKKHWLYTDEGRRTVWRTGIFILAITIITEFFIKLHPHFPIEEYFAFYAFFGFLSCIVMVIFAKLLGFLIKRKDNYYDK